MKLLGGGPRFEQPRADITGQGQDVHNTGSDVQRTNFASTVYTHAQECNLVSKVEKYKKITRNTVKLSTN